jgi:hypothetical protein
MLTQISPSTNRHTSGGGPSSSALLNVIFSAGNNLNKFIMALGGYYDLKLPWVNSQMEVQGGLSQDQKSILGCLVFGLISQESRPQGQ